MPSFIELLQAQFAHHADRPAITYRDQVITFGQLERAAKRVGAMLQERGLRKGDRVVIFTTEKLPFLITHLGIILSGGVSLPLNAQFTKDEMTYFLNDSGARFAIASPSGTALLRDIHHSCPTVEAIVEYGDIISADAAEKFRDVDIVPDDPCFMLYSSGTTGHPKGVVYTHRTEAAGLLALQRCWRMTPDDRILNVLPLHHLHGLSFATHLSWVTGSTVLIEDQMFSAMERLRDATVFMAIPTMYYAFLRRPEFREQAKQWHRMRVFTCGSAPIRPEVLPELETILGHHLINRYGMTEGHVITSIPFDGPWPQGSVGVPLDGMDLKVVGEDGIEVPAGVRRANGSVMTGEVRIRSAYLFTEYWKKPEATAAAFDRDGFFLTGDIGVHDADGFLTLLGRKSDLIIVDGENVYPAVVERVLNRFDHVRESAVIGVPDARRGERVVAVVVPDGALDMRELQRHCAERLSPTQRPTQFECVASLPRNTMGKVLKRALRVQYAPTTIRV